MEQFVGVVQVADRGSVDFLHGQPCFDIDLRGDGIRLDLSEDHDVLLFLEDALGDVVRVKAADGDVLELRGGEKVGVKRLEDKPCEDDVARLLFILDRIHAGSCERLERDLDIVP